MNKLNKMDFNDIIKKKDFIYALKLDMMHFNKDKDNFCFQFCFL